MQTIKNFMSDLRDLQDAAAAHNLQSDSPPTGSSGAAPPQTAVNNQAHGPVPLPPPPPRHLPHGWTARYDEQEKKYAYSHGVTAQEQWEFPADTKQPPQFPPDLNVMDKLVESKLGTAEAQPTAVAAAGVKPKTTTKPPVTEEMIAEEVD